MEEKEILNSDGADFATSFGAFAYAPQEGEREGKKGKKPVNLEPDFEFAR